jgi:hypothetical protein
MSNFKISKFTVVFFFLAIIFVVAAFYYINTNTPRVPNYNNQAGSLAHKSPVLPVPVSVASNTTPSLLNLPIPFTSQAPTGNWDTVHNEDCEEAVSVMANAYLTGNTSQTIAAAQVDSEMNNLNSWEDSAFGYHLDTTAEETAQMIEGVYGLQTKVVENYTAQDIKDQINLHHVVILPVNGQEIGNPNYRQPGPIYHMLVIRGYTSTDLITNDSGTRRGQNYPYTFNTLYNAGANWDHSTNTIDQTKKVIIIVWK